MIACSTGCTRAAMIGLALFGLVRNAPAQTPSPAAVAIAQQVIDVKGAGHVYDPVLTGIIVRARDALMQANPMLSNDLNAVAQQLRRDFQPRLDALRRQVAIIYASLFTEQELKDALAFYQSPLGLKLVKAEPEAVRQSMAYANDWAIKLEDEVLAKMRAEMRKRGHEL